ncbi:MAG TPA: response regulator transcription factor [Candidatus Saccharimonadia bacterium]|nr:response regulator transcription factor [Candidatus Saccharimonadia bacterium]
MPLKISLVEDDAGTREMLATLVSREADMTCLQTYSRAEDAIIGVPKEVPDVLLVDINLPGKSGIECVSELKAALPNLQMMIVTTYDDSENIFHALRAGATGYLLKRSPGAEIIAAIRDVHAGGSPMSASIARKVVAFFHKVPKKKSPGPGQLTEREEQILELLSKGLQYKEIATKLDLGVSTVRTHLHTVYVKLHVNTRTEAVVKFLRR